MCGASWSAAGGYSETRARLGPADRQPYIIAFTADVLTGDGERFHEAGMNASISKPVVIDLLAEALEACPAGSVRSKS